MENAASTDFDVRICCLTTFGKVKYRTRFDAFLRFGVLSPTPRTTTVALTDDFAGEYRGVPCVKCGDGPAIVDRFLSYLLSCPLDSDWYFCVDSDSSTHAPFLIERLKAWYDPAYPVMLTAGENTDLESAQIGAVGSDKWWLRDEHLVMGTKHKEFVHAWGGTLLSRAAVTALREKQSTWLPTVKRIKERGGFFQDQAEGVVARLCRIPVVGFPYLTYVFDYKNYRALNRGGMYAHIHYVVDSSPYFGIFADVAEGGVSLMDEKEVELLFLRRRNALAPKLSLGGLDLIKLSGVCATANGELTCSGNDSFVCCAINLTPPFEVRFEAWVEDHNLRIYYCCSDLYSGFGRLILNWEVDENQLIFVDPTTGKESRAPTGRVPKKEFLPVLLSFTAGECVLSVKEKELLRRTGDYKNLSGKVGWGSAYNGRIKIRNVELRHAGT